MQQPVVEILTIYENCIFLLLPFAVWLCTQDDYSEMSYSGKILSIPGGSMSPHVLISTLHASMYPYI